MPEPKKIRETLESYLQGWRSGNREEWLSLFTEDATLTDPVGTPANEGKAAISEFWDRIHTLPMSFEPDAERIVVCENESMMVFTMVSRAESGVGMSINIVNTFVHSDDGRITQLKAYWDNGCMGAAP